MHEQHTQEARENRWQAAARLISDLKQQPPATKLSELEYWEWHYRWHRLLGPTSVWPEGMLYQAWGYAIDHARDEGKLPEVEQIARVVESEIAKGYALIPPLRIPIYTFQRGCREGFRETNEMCENRYLAMAREGTQWKG